MFSCFQKSGATGSAPSVLSCPTLSRQEKGIGENLQFSPVDLPPADQESEIIFGRACTCRKYFDLCALGAHTSPQTGGGGGRGGARSPPSPPSPIPRQTKELFAGGKRGARERAQFSPQAETEPSGLCDELSPEATSCLCQRAHGSAGGTRSAPPARRCWRPPGSCPGPVPWSAWR